MTFPGVDAWLPPVSSDISPSFSVLDQLLLPPIMCAIFLGSGAHSLLNLATLFQLYPAHRILSNFVSFSNRAYLDQAAEFLHKHMPPAFELFRITHEAFPSPSPPSSLYFDDAPCHTLG
jgi:hypothetical protein